MNDKYRKIGIIILVSLCGTVLLYLGGLFGQMITNYNRWMDSGGAAGVQTGLSQKINESGDVVILDALDLNALAGGHGQSAGAETLGSFRHCTGLIGGQKTISGEDADIEDVGIPLVPQTAQALDTLDVGLGQDSFVFHNDTS